MAHHMINYTTHHNGIVDNKYKGHFIINNLKRLELFMLNGDLTNMHGVTV